MQEFQFDCKGSLNLNANVLSCCSEPETPESTAVTITVSSPELLHQLQQQDSVIKQLHQALKASNLCPKDRQWSKSPLHHYKQLWHQLLLVDEVVCHKLCPRPTVTGPVLPLSLQPEALQCCHDEPSAGHFGFNKMLHKL